MALNPDTNATMAGRITAADADYPYGSSQNETSPGAGDGTPYFKGRADDIFGFQQWLLTVAGIVPTGTADNVNASQYGEALRSIFGNVGLTVMTASGTYNPPDNAKALLVIATGGGGGGGGATAPQESGGQAGGGGGGGATGIAFVSNLDPSYPVTVGAGGSGGPGAGDGSNGGSTTVGSGSHQIDLTAPGGGGGEGAVDSTSYYSAGGGISASSGASIDVSGGRGGPGVSARNFNNAGVTSTGSNGGGSTFWGSGSVQNAANGAGVGITLSPGLPATVPGGGGSGGYATSPNDQPGGDGADGVVFILEFYQL